MEDEISYGFQPFRPAGEDQPMQAFVFDRSRKRSMCGGKFGDRSGKRTASTPPYFSLTWNASGNFAIHQEVLLPAQEFFFGIGHAPRNLMHPHFVRIRPETGEVHSAWRQLHAEQQAAGGARIPFRASLVLDHLADSLRFSTEASRYSL